MRALSGWISDMAGPGMNDLLTQNMRLLPENRSTNSQQYRITAKRGFGAPSGQATPPYMARQTRVLI